MNIDKVIELNLPLDVINIDRRNILIHLGYKEKRPEEEICQIIDDKIQKGMPMINPRGGYIIKEVREFDQKQGVVQLENTIFNINRIITSQITGAQYIALFICTIGKKLEDESKKLLSGGEPLEGYTLDLLASEVTENIAEYIHQNIGESMIHEGYGITNRFSPGYCKWDVKEQFKLFPFFPDNFCGITLNSSALMQPIKSVSGIIGIGKGLQRKLYICSRCDETNCIYRTQNA